jgi:hypothetical protein
VLNGRFGNTSHRPYLEGYIVFPRLGCAEVLSFLVDTGADHTCIMPGDAASLGIERSQLEDPLIGRGAGGPFRSFLEEAWLVFADGTDLVGYNLRVAVLEPGADTHRMPSLLGRDIIHRWHMNYDFNANRLEFDVLTSDVVLPSTGTSLGTPTARWE